MVVRKTSKVPTRIWRFHAIEPSGEDARAVREVLWRSGRYYNTLIEIERDRQARYAAIRREYAPNLAALEDEWERLDERAGDLVREAKRTRQRHWQRTRGDKTLAVPAGIDAALTETQAAKKLVAGNAKPLRAAFSARLTPDRVRYKTETQARAAGAGPRIKSRVNADVLAEMLADVTTDAAWRAVARSDDDAQQLVRAARARCGLPPGTYLVIEEAVARARKDASPRTPRFRASRGEGKIAVQLRDTIVDDVFAGRSMFLRLDPDPRANRKGRSEQHFTARVRVGSDERAPIWAAFPVRLHRRPPNDAVVKWAWITVRRHGERTRYELQLVLEHASFADAKRPAGVGDGGHVRIGWGQTDCGVRVATWDGGDLIVPRSILSRAEHGDALRSHADTHFAVVKRVIRLITRTSGWERVQSDRRRLELRSICVAFAEHVFGDDLRTLWRRWVDSRPRDLFVSIAEARRWLDAPPRHALAWWLYMWARKDVHLRQWSADVRASVERRRDALFRETAIRLSTQYETLSVDRYSIAALKQHPRPLAMPGEAPNAVAQHNAQVAAPGRFREILLEVMGSRCTPRERSGDGEEAVGARELSVDPHHGPKVHSPASANGRAGAEEDRRLGTAREAGHASP